MGDRSSRAAERGVGPLLPESQERSSMSPPPAASNGGGQHHHQQMSMLESGSGRKRFNWKAPAIVLVFELLESIAFSGVALNLVVYLGTVLHGSIAFNAAHVYTWNGTTLSSALSSPTATGASTRPSLPPSHSTSTGWRCRRGARSGTSSGCPWRRWCRWRWCSYCSGCCSTTPPSFWMWTLISVGNLLLYMLLAARYTLIHHAEEPDESRID